jgi:hypothetical protein
VINFKITKTSFCQENNIISSHFGPRYIEFLNTKSQKIPWEIETDPKTLNRFKHPFVDTNIFLFERKALILLTPIQKIEGVLR